MRVKESLLTEAKLEGTACLSHVFFEGHAVAVTAAI